MRRLQRAACIVIVAVSSGAAAACGDVDTTGAGTTPVPATATAPTAPSTATVAVPTAPSSATATVTAPTTATSTAPDDYRALLADACSRRDAAERAIEPDDSEDPAQLASFFDGLRTAALQFGDEIAALAPPPDLAEPHQAAVAAAPQIADLLTEGAQLARGGRADELETSLYPRIVQAAQPLDDLATRAGVPECAVD